MKQAESTQAPLPSSLQDVLDRFAACANARERLALLLQMGRALSPLDEAEKGEETLIPDCQSVVHIVGQLDEDRLCFRGSADALLVKGMVALLIEGLNGLTPEEVTAIEPELLRGSGLGQSLVPSRANGLFNILMRMKAEATRLQQLRNCGTTVPT